MKRILWVTARSTGGGAEAVVRELHTAALAEGIDSHWIVLTEVSTSRVLENMHFIKAKKASNALLALRSKIRTLNPDVVYANMTYLNILTVLACAFLRIKIVGVEHNIVFSPITGHFTKSILLRWLARITYRSLNCVICVSNGVALDVQKYFGVSKTQAVVIGNPVRPLNYLTHKPKAFGYIGAHTKQKGLDVLAAAYNEYRQKGGQRRLLIAGQGPLKAKLQNYFEREKLQENVDFLGFVDDVQHFYDSVDVVVVPSIWEGFCNVVAEGILSGSLVLASNCHSGPSDICNTLGEGVLFEVGNINDLVQKMEDTELTVSVSEISDHPYRREEVVRKYLKCVF